MQNPEYPNSNRNTNVTVVKNNFIKNCGDKVVSKREKIKILKLTEISAGIVITTVIVNACSVFCNSSIYYLNDGDFARPSTRTTFR